MHDAEAGSLYSVIVVSDTLPVFCEEPFAVVAMILQNKTPSDFVKPQFSLTVYGTCTGCYAISSLPNCFDSHVAPCTGWVVQLVCPLADILISDALGIKSGA